MDDQPNIDGAIKAVLAGRREAFGEIVREYELTVRGYLGVLLYHLDDVDDVAQEVFVAAFEKLGTFRRGENFGAWLRGIARNKAKMFLRSEARRGGAIERFRHEIARAVQADVDEAAAEVTESMVRKLLLCIARLPERMRQVVRSTLHGQGAAETARRLAMSVNALYVTSHRANRLLRTCMNEEDA